MVHSALKRRAFADDFKDLSTSQPSQEHDILKPPSSTTALSSTSNTKIHPPPHAGHTSRAPIPVLLEMMTPQEFATVLRARVDRLVSQWPLYASQPFPHGLPSPSSSGSPLVQSGGKGIEMSTIHSFVSFFYPEEHHIHHNGDIPPNTLFVHLSGLQTLLSFLSSKELRVVVRNRLTACSSERSPSVQAIKNLPASDLSNPVKTKSYVDVGTSTEPSETLAFLARPSSSDEFRPPKRPKYASSYPLFQEVVDDMIMKSTSNQNTTPSYHHHPDAMSSSVHKMTDPILRPVSNASFKKSPAASQVVNIEDDGEADAEGDTDTDIEMDDSVDERHDSKTLTIAQVINSFRPEEHASTNHTSHSQTSFSNPSLNKPIPTSTLGPSSESSCGILTNSAIPKGSTTVIMPNRVGDIPKGPSTMRGLVMPNESTYTVSSSGSRTPSRQKDLSLSRTDTSSLQVKQELLSDWETTIISTSKGDGTNSSPIEVSEGMPRVRSVVKEQEHPLHHRSSSIVSSSSSTLPQTRKFEFGASCQGVRSAVKEQEPIQHRSGSTAFSESTHQQKRKLGASIQDTLNSTFDGGNQSPYDGHDLPPYDEIMTSNPTSMSSKPIASASDTTSASTSKQHRSKLATRDQISSRFPENRRRYTLLRRSARVLALAQIQNSWTSEFGMHHRDHLPVQLRVRAVPALHHVLAYLIVREIILILDLLHHLQQKTDIGRQNRLVGRENGAEAGVEDVEEMMLHPSLQPPDFLTQ
ncbi:hypothetical protein Clacol_010518 [Clathrus columnatus]|uniref:Uncharacterized protein n=1 Tax=Clathrus columnatus TaxID=1419009 RepID=A0AAV5AQW9_9AGAM|nr:hypothetical protein Clacol_010518 [Clathrus columnatus]